MALYGKLSAPRKLERQKEPLSVLLLAVFTVGHEDNCTQRAVQQTWLVTVRRSLESVPTWDRNSL